MPDDFRLDDRSTPAFAQGLGLVLVLSSAVLAAVGLWFAVLGGTLFYLFAATGSGIVAFYLIRGDRAALGVYLVVFLVALVWALMERGTTGWAHPLHVLMPLIVMVLVMLAMPWLRRRRSSRPGLAAALLLVLGLAVIAQTWLDRTDVAVQGASSRR